VRKRSAVTKFKGTEIKDEKILKCMDEKRNTKAVKWAGV
jgi:hypothetical protein